jgi:protein-arginine kinase activator protein McsA
MLCNACHEREATIHTTMCAPDGIKVTDLCSKCFEASLVPGLAGAPCRYCGAQADIGLSDFLEVSAGIQRTQATCFACSQDRDDYLQKRLGTVPPDLAQGPQLRQGIEDFEAYMNRRVKERRSQ